MSQDDFLRRQQMGRRYGIAGAIGVALFTLGILISWGLLALPQIPTTETMESIVVAIVVISSFIGGFGLVMIVVSLIKFQYRAPWFFWVLAACAIMFASAMPSGITLGALLIIWLLVKRREFFEPPVAKPSSSK